jgi:hypothetical protein
MIEALLLGIITGMFFGIVLMVWINAKLVYEKDELIKRQELMIGNLAKVINKIGGKK